MAAAPGATTVIFPIDCGLRLEVDAVPAATLEPWDLAVLSDRAGSIRRLELPGSSPAAAAAVFVATLGVGG